MKSSEILVGTLVENPSAPDWGPGRVVDIRGDTAHVFFRDFEDHRAKRFKANRLRLAEEQSDPILDNLPPFTDKSGELSLSSRRVTMNQARDKFLGHYPGGFNDEGYLGDLKRGERNYKWRAHEEWLKVFGDGKAEELLASGAIGEMNKRVNKLVTSVNLLPPEDAAAFKAGLADEDAGKVYYRTLLDVLESGPAMETFEPYATSVAMMAAMGPPHADKWSAATILPFLARPDAFMFVKSTAAIKAGDRLGFDLHFVPRTNWTTYDAVLRMSRIYFDLLEDLGPRDMIDVQSFFWVTSEQPAKSRTKRTKSPAKAATKAEPKTKAKTKPKAK